MLSSEFENGVGAEVRRNGVVYSGGRGGEMQKCASLFSKDEGVVELKDSDEGGRRKYSNDPSPDILPNNLAPNLPYPNPLSNSLTLPHPAPSTPSDYPPPPFQFSPTSSPPPSSPPH